MMEFDGDDDEVMDMLEVPSNRLLRDVRAHIVDDQDPGSPSIDFGPNIRRKIELTIAPRSIYLQVTISIRGSAQ